MTRKKFIKHAMAKGYSRNRATRIAKEVIPILKTYKRCYEHLIYASWLKCEFGVE